MLDLGYALWRLNNLPPKTVTFVSWDKNQSQVVFNDKYVPIYLLKEKLALHGYDLGTTWDYSIQRSDLVLNASVFYDFPDNVSEKSFLWLLESPITVSLPVGKEEENKYRKIFTWNPDFDGVDKYVYIPIPYDYKEFDVTSEDIRKKDVLVVQVAGNNYWGDAYQLRRDDTLWFLEQAPNDYKFAGPYWDIFKETLSQRLKECFDEKYYGYVNDKKTFLKQGKFSLVYENASAKGYVSEKIYDAMSAGTVPIYWGAPDIENHVPKACFISRSDFKTMEELHSFLKNMSDDTYLKYIECISLFMKNGKNHPNAIDRVFNIITDEMVFGNGLYNQVVLSLKRFLAY